MTTLADNKVRAYGIGDLNDYPVVADDCIYEGAAVGLDSSGNARPLVAGDTFVGFSMAKADNTGGSAGDINVNVRSKGLIELPVTGVDGDDDVKKPVYASDDDAFTLTESTNSHIGRIHRHVSSTVCIVAFDANRGGLGEVGELTDSSGGTADGEVAEVTDLATSDTYSDAAVNAKLAIINDNFAELSGKLNDVLRQLG